MRSRWVSKEGKGRERKKRKLKRREGKGRGEGRESKGREDENRVSFHTAEESAPVFLKSTTNR